MKTLQKINLERTQDLMKHFSKIDKCVTDQLGIHCC